jgi:uncharacterized protein YoxC
MKSEVFFFITTIAIVVMTIALLVAIIYIIIFLRDLTHVSKRVRKESDEILDDVSELRADLKRDGFRMKKLTSFFKGVFKKRRKSDK